MTEAGYPDVEGEGWFAFIVPAGTPKEITALLHREIVKAIALPEIKEKVATLGFEAVGNSPDEASALFNAESVKWAKVIQQGESRHIDAEVRSLHRVDFRYWHFCDITRRKVDVRFREHTRRHWRCVPERAIRISRWNS